MTTLQINTNGAWRTVCEFDESKRSDVLAAVRILHFALGGKAKWCTLTGGQREWLHPDKDPPSAVLILQDDGHRIHKNWGIDVCWVSSHFTPHQQTDSPSHKLALAVVAKIVKLADDVSKRFALS